MKHRKKHIWASIMILLIVAFDQVTKRLAESALMGGKIVTLLPGAVQLRYARNIGMAFFICFATNAAPCGATGAWGCWWPAVWAI